MLHVRAEVAVMVVGPAQVAMQTVVVTPLSNWAAKAHHMAVVDGMAAHVFEMVVVAVVVVVVVATDAVVEKGMTDADTYTVVVVADVEVCVDVGAVGVDHVAGTNIVVVVIAVDDIYYKRRHCTGHQDCCYSYSDYYNTRRAAADVRRAWGRSYEYLTGVVVAAVAPDAAAERRPVAAEGLAAAPAGDLAGNGLAPAAPM